MDKIAVYIRTEPARITGFGLALLGLLAAFGLGVSGEQSGAIMGVVSSVVVLFGGEVTRSQVKPVSSVPVEAPLNAKPPASTDEQAFDAAANAVPDDEPLPNL